MSDRHRVCPWWKGYLLLSPLRRMRQDPVKILSPYVHEGMRVLEIGPGMGFFTIPMARLVGDGGSVTAVDIQERMLAALGKRARGAGVAQRIELKLASQESLCLDRSKPPYDFGLAFGVVHEILDHAAFFRELHDALKPGAFFLMADPLSRFTSEEYESALAVASTAGFIKIWEPFIRRSRTALLRNGLPMATGGF
jgi:cyclopropane fatty-acyl-phospholipid synthase-like methyltransferase